MVKINITVERPLKLTKEQTKVLAEVYSKLWTEAYYDPTTTETREFARPLADKMIELNKQIKFTK